MHWNEYEHAKMIEEKLDLANKDLKGAGSLLNVEWLDVSFSQRYCRGVELPSVSQKAAKACLAICINDLKRQIKDLEEEFEEV